MKYIIKNTFYLVVILNVMFYVIPVQEVAAQSKELKERDRYAQADLFIQAVRERELGNLQKAKELNDEALAINSEDRSPILIIHTMAITWERPSKIQSWLAVKQFLLMWFRFLPVFWCLSFQKWCHCNSLVF